LPSAFSVQVSGFEFDKNHFKMQIAKCKMKSRTEVGWATCLPTLLPTLSCCGGHKERAHPTASLHRLGAAEGMIMVAIEDIVLETVRYPNMAAFASYAGKVNAEN
jgi:hypothetical protein